jgi:hypothetical protein
MLRLLTIALAALFLCATAPAFAGDSPSTDAPAGTHHKGKKGKKDAKKTEGSDDANKDKPATP